MAPSSEWTSASTGRLNVPGWRWSGRSLTYYTTMAADKRRSTSEQWIVGKVGSQSPWVVIIGGRGGSSGGRVCDMMAAEDVAATPAPQGDRGSIFFVFRAGSHEHMFKLGGKRRI